MLVLFMSNSLQFSPALLRYFAHGKVNNLLQCGIAYNWLFFKNLPKVITFFCHCIFLVPNYRQYTVCQSIPVQ